jgi:two-component system, LytTR family, response regulator
MYSLDITRMFLRNPLKNSSFLFFSILLLCIIICIALPLQFISGANLDLIKNLKNLIFGIFLPELVTLSILVYLINIFHDVFKIHKIQLTFASILRYEFSFLPLFVTSFFIFFPITLHVRFLLREFPVYTFDRYLFYLNNALSINSLLLYLPIVVIFGYLILNISLGIDLYNRSARAASSQPTTKPLPIRPIVVPTPVVANPPVVVVPIAPVVTPPTVLQPSIDKPKPVKRKEIEKTVVPEKKRFLDMIEGRSEETGKLLPLYVKDCHFFETKDEVYYAQHITGLYRIVESITMLEKNLDPRWFFRGHRHFIVNFRYIDSYSHWEKGKYVIRTKMPYFKELYMPISRYDAFRAAYLNFAKIDRLQE